MLSRTHPRLTWFSTTNGIARIDMRSDTVTAPSQRMRNAMSQSHVGDDVYGEDPTCLELEKRGAMLLNKEACCFVTSGTMGNLASLMSHCYERGSEVILGHRSHIYCYEQGGMSTLAGLFPRVLENLPNGTLNVQQVLQSIQQSSNAHYAHTALVCVENTHNNCGGVVLPMSYLKELKTALAPHRIPIHMDGARVGSATVKLNLPLSTVCADVDSVSLCLSKGLGAPVGSLVCGTEEFIHRIRRCKKVLGGGWRQAGILASAGLIALDEMQETLQRDHDLATKFAIGLQSIPRITVPRLPETNLVFFQVDDAPTVVKEAKQLGVWMGSGYGDQGKLIRAVLHKDISPLQVERALEVMQSVMTST